MTEHMSAAPPVQGVRIRPIQPADAEDLQRFYAGLSDESRRRRFLSSTAGLGTQAATFFCGPDHSHREGFVAVAAGPRGPMIVGHLCVEPAGPRAAEIAVAVADAFQGHGVGRRLSAEALRWARRHGVDRLCATCAVENAGILRLLRGLRRSITFGPLAGGSVDVSINVAGAPAHGSAAA